MCMSAAGRGIFPFTYHRLVSISPDEQSQEGSEDQLQKKPGNV